MSEGRLKSLQYTEEEKQAIWKAVGVTESSLKQGVDHILEWFEKQPHFTGVFIDKVIVEKTIIMSKGSVEKAKERIDKIYKFRSMAPEIIQNRERILCDPHTKLFEQFTKVVLPELHEGKRVCFLQVEPGVLHIDTEDFFKKGAILNDLRLKYDYWLSDIWVVDGRNITAGLVFSMKLNVTKKASNLFLNGLKWRIDAIHLINLPFSKSITQYVLDFFKQFSSSLMMSRIVIHESLESLYEHIPRHCLPEDYGGNSPSIKNITENFNNEVKDPKLIEFLLECTKMISDESKRPHDDSSEDLAGSFRQLEFD